MQGISLSMQKHMNTDPVTLESEVRRLKMLKTSSDQAAALYKEAQEHVLKLLEQAGRKTAKVDDIKITKVQGTSTRIDEKGLAKALGAAMWNKITKKSLDKGKLEDKIERGEIDINVVAQHTTVAENAPYIRLSAALEDEPDDDN